ncbi:hypothetical protein H0H92_006725 [Tricholoma furcatifolium]|nr:hypothetical protein H0H92_006725 [Tricholoma furcatifolium]
MRLSLTLVVSALVACFLPFVVATHNAQYSRPDSSLGKGKHASHKRLTSQVIAQRQHHVHRDLIDVCINIEAAVIVPILHLLDPLAAGLRLCLCLQDLNVFLDSDVGVLLGGILGGKDSLLAKIKLLLNTSPDAEQCTFPAHSHHACVAGHSCAFQCDPPYIKDASGTNCGCSSAHPVPKRQVTGPITSYTAAKATCKSGETICGIPGRENPNAFECIDTTVSLDSCGGCVTPHRFADGPASPKGIDCGRLPGVSASSCSNSQCKVTHCRMGRELNEERNECVKVPTGSPRRRSLRMEKASKRDNNNIDVVLSTELAGQIHAYILLVGNLNNTCQALASTSSHATGAPSINYEYYVGTILSATLEALRSTTVVSLVTNIDTMVNVNTLALNAFLQCGCVDALGLQSLYHDLVAVVDAALTMQTWCSNHPASTPSDPSNPSTVSNTSPAHIIVGLDDLLHLLGINSKDTHVELTICDVECYGYSHNFSLFL